MMLSKMFDNRSHAQAIQIIMFLVPMQKNLSIPCLEVVCFFLGTGGWFFCICRLELAAFKVGVMNC